MHLGYLHQEEGRCDRRTMLRGGAAGGAALAAIGLARPLSAGDFAITGAGGQNLAVGQEWIDAFFHKGATAVANYYADDFVFEDIILNQMINTKDDLLKAFEPFDNYGPESPLGIHQFDIIRFNGGRRAGQADEFQTGTPPGYDAVYWTEKTADARAGGDLEYDEWAIMHWLWKVQHNADFLGMAAKGKTTHIRGVTHHLYKGGKINREYSYWNYRDIAIQLGALPQPENRHELSFEEKSAEE
jgi:steroid delta-isomerase-like uncharacterized protein